MQRTSHMKFGVIFAAASISLYFCPGTFATTFTEIASTNTAVPNGQPGETFGNGIAIHPAIADGTVYFIGGGNEGTGGLYSGDGGPLSIVADTNTNIPNSSNQFPYIADNPSASGSNVSFDLGTNAGVYANIGGSLVTIADTNTTAPGESFKFSSFTNSSISGNNVAFSASDIINRPGVYSSLNLAPLALVANTSTPSTLKLWVQMA
jgi:hypothetical protein